MIFVVLTGKGNFESQNKNRTTNLKTVNSE
jgi:hypothetical protein